MKNQEVNDNFKLNFLELVDKKFKFDEDLKKAKEKFPNNKTLAIMAQVFFPINKFEHYYLICYHIKIMGYFITDNILRDAEPKVYYGRVREVFHSHFCNYISQNGNPGLAARVRRLKPCYLSMPWQTTKNSTDCGIFLMRHMETFKGDHKNWNN
ncbi:hypothetical protein DCAR_0205707 [Daucus carota subsp. sativus]|uniref:Ubiquitin-like protease family profile domain-containing protein n=1 Tax=Daucus carota subsp. sativus TaxID=79200 RepID=A0AAF0WBQ5_DAUCS|nr:hypothetical protein DCAR_0205707 [Daucus carota subsp. sativus]